MGALRRFVPLSALAVLLAALPASAANPQLIFGPWLEKLPNGNGMVTQFLPNSVASQPVDPFNHPAGPVNRLSATYTDMGQALVGVNMQGGNGIVVTIVNPQNIILNFGGGTDVHQLVRMP